MTPPVMSEGERRQYAISIRKAIETELREAEALSRDAQMIPGLIKRKLARADELLEQWSQLPTPRKSRAKVNA